MVEAWSEDLGALVQKREDQIRPEELCKLTQFFSLKIPPETVGNVYY